MPGARAAGAGSAWTREHAPAETLLYLSCVLEAGTEAHRLLRLRALAGMEPGAPLFPLEAGELVAAVSEVPAARFGQEALNHLLADLQSVAPLAVRHDEAIRALADAAPALVPVAFGAVYQTTERVIDLLHSRAGEFRRLLDLLHGKQEWGLKIFADMALFCAAVEQADEQLSSLADEARTASPGRAYLLRKRHAQLAAGTAERRAREVVEQIVGQLARLSEAARVEQPQVAPPDGPRLLSKTAFLVADSKAEPFRAAARELEPSLAPLGISLEITGPWAAYSFVTPDSDASSHTT